VRVAVRGGAHATIDGGRLVALHPDAAHPTGRALCVKGKAAPELVYHPQRLLHPLKRTAPKGAADPVDGHLVEEARLALSGVRRVATLRGPVLCRPVFDLLAERCREMEPAVAGVAIRSSNRQPGRRRRRPPDDIPAEGRPGCAGSAAGWSPRPPSPHMARRPADRPHRRR
jgi:hypothetical protein